MLSEINQDITYKNDLELLWIENNNVINFWPLLKGRYIL